MRLQGIIMGFAMAGLMVACDETALQTVQSKPDPAAAQKGPIAAVQSRLNGRALAQNFVAVVAAVEPVAEAECLRRTQGIDCDFKIVIDDNPRLPPNAGQTIDRGGRPIIIFTLALVASAQNRDELAFVLGHEAAHHIAGHLQRQRQAAVAGAQVFGELASVSGAGNSRIEAAQQLGAALGARTYSKDFELEADALGTVIAARAGFDPLIGAQFFARIPDPGNRFLGTHPPNAARLEIVRRTVARGGL